MVVIGVVGGHQLEASDPFCARLRSARQLFDDWARTTPPQKAARGGETVSRALFAQSHSEHVVGVLYVSLVLV